MELTLQNAGSLVNIDFVLITGDMMRHNTNNLSNSDLLAIVQTIVDLLAKYFVNVPPLHFAISVIGNNDSPIDYFFNISDPSQV